MTEELNSRILAAISKFLRKLELEKTAKCLEKETKARGWAIEQGEDGGKKPFNLSKLYLAEERRRRQQTGSQTDDANSQQAAEREEESQQQPPKKKCRMQQQLESDAGSHAAAEDKKKKTRMHKSVQEEEDTEAAEEHEAAGNGEGGKTKKKNGLKRFQRIDDSQWTSTLPAELKDNSFWKKKNDNFAVKAAEQLGRVRGKDFRHEKTKKKKATWKGCGEIPMTVNSIQFASDSD
ncbi:hypothetical protein Efla_001083 [Eimeria flavescens]